MDTNRISIINRDLSESLPTPNTATTGYIVVKAEKGSTKAVYVPAGSSTSIYEYVGYPSAEYPDIQEVLDFNATHGVYISAPYDASAHNKVPVAYVTPAGVLSRSEPIDLGGVALESIEEDGAEVEGINAFVSDQTVLIPMGREPSYFNLPGQDVATPITYSVGSSSVVSFNVGVNLSPTAGELATPEISKFFAINPSAFSSSEPYRIFRQATSGVAGILSVDIPGVPSLIDLYLVVNGSSLYIQDNEGHDIGQVSGSSITALSLNTSFSQGALSGLYATYFSTSAISIIWPNEAFRNSVRVYWKASLNKNAIYATFYQKYISSRETTLTFGRQKLDNVISFTVSEKITPTAYGSRVITGSLREDDKDGFGADIGFKQKLANQPFINIAVIKPFDSETIFTKTETPVGPTFTPSAVVLKRGVRVFTEASREDGWAEALKSEYDIVEVFINPIPLTSSTTLFTTLGDTHKVSRFIASKTVSPGNATDALPALTYGRNYYIITNLFVRKSAFTKEDFISPLVGSYASMIAKCIDQKYGGVAPMFLNAGGLGGQLNVSVKKAVYQYTKEQLDYLDVANYNPIIRDATHGVMVTSQKTANGTVLSDWSYIGHSSAFLKFQREIRDTVLFPQIGKPINPYYKELRAQQVETLLKPRIQGLDRIWAEGIVDTEAVNTIETAMQRKFIIAVTVKVDIFSEGVELIFTNVGQNVILS